MEEFLGTLRYHYMAIGSLTALVLFNWGEAYCRSFVANRWAQGVVFSLIVSYYCFHLPIPDLGIAVLYGLAILSLSVAPKRLLNLEWEPLVYLGKVSYGLYIYHMLADYPLRLAFAKLHLVNTPNDFLAAGYCIILVFFTILIAHISYRYFESPFLRLGHSSTKPSPFRGDPSSSVQASAIK